MIEIPIAQRYEGEFHARIYTEQQAKASPEVKRCSIAQKNQEKSASSLKSYTLDGQNSRKVSKVKRRKERQLLKDPEYKRLLTNSRERCRQQSLNEAFQLLRTVIPLSNKDTKLSKYAILRSAIKYMSFLEELLANMEMH
eukprot:gene3106-1400_t